jgi:magnesium chelatase subunit H
MTVNLKQGTQQDISTRVVIVTMDTHLNSAVDRARAGLKRLLPHLSLTIHSASEFATNPEHLAQCRQDIAQGDIIIVTMLFMEDHFLPILADLQARREHCDAMVCAMSAGEVVKLTRIGKLDMSKPASGPMAFLKKMRGNPKDDSEKAAAGAKQMKMLRRIPQMLRFIPGTAQDLRAYFLTLQYWLGGSQENIQGMVHYLADRYATSDKGRSKNKVLPPVEYPEVGIYHPRMKSRLSDQLTDLPTVVSADKARGRV